MDIRSDAIISKDGNYRYCLSRIWEDNLPLLGWIMLNPSTASKTTNDATIRTCMRIAMQFQYGGIIVTNLFAYRTTYPAELMKLLRAQAIGPENDEWLRRFVHNPQIATITLAWGAKGGFLNRDQEVLRLISEEKPRCDIKCLGYTHKEMPVHPLGTIGPVKLLDWRR